MALPGNSTINFGTPDKPVALKIPSVPPPFSGASDWDPVTWFYTLRLTIDMPGMLTDVVWEFPVGLTALPTATVLAQPSYAPLGAVVVAGGVCGEAPPAPPPGGVFAGPYPTANVVSVLAPAPITNREEDEHNFNAGAQGPPPPFQPVYAGAVAPTPCAFVLPAHGSAAAAGAPLLAPAALEMGDRNTAA